MSADVEDHQKRAAAPIRRSVSDESVVRGQRVAVAPDIKVLGS